MLACKTGATRFSDKREAGLEHETVRRAGEDAEIFSLLFFCAFPCRACFASTPSWCSSEKREKKSARSALTEETKSKLR